MKKHKYYFREKLKYCVKISLKKQLLLFIRNNTFLNGSLRQRSLNKLTEINKIFNLNKLKKFCIFTGRLRYVINQTKFSRMIFRELASRGCLCGVMKNA
jgi:small subunit ribosomal protein S14